MRTPIFGCYIYVPYMKTKHVFDVNNTNLCMVADCQLRHASDEKVISEGITEPSSIFLDLTFSCKYCCLSISFVSCSWKLI